jgi:ABC-type nitrate/sulfonate/bicarbonate transport system substrate-binding protein
VALAIIGAHTAPAGAGGGGGHRPLTITSPFHRTTRSKKDRAMFTRFTRLTAVLASAALIGSLAGCASADPVSTSDPSSDPTPTELTKVRMTTGFAPNANVTNIVAAIDQGYFQDEGIEVEILAPSSATDAVKLLNAGDTDLIGGNSLNQVIARAEGVPLVSVATTLQYSNQGIMTRAEDGITSVAQLEGKTIGMIGFAGNTAILEDILRREGVDPASVNFVTVGFTGAQALAQKQVDALGDALDNIPALYNAVLQKPVDDESTYNIMKFRDLGAIRYYINTIVTTDTYLQENEETVRSFLAAWQKGLEWAIDHPEEAAEATVERYPDLQVETITAQWKALSAAATSEETEEHGLGWQEAGVYEGISAFLFENQVSAEEVDAAQLMTNDYLPEQE